MKAGHGHDIPEVPRETPFVTGCALVARPTVFETVGGFHPAFFAYHEDVEWSWRLSDAGITSMVVPAARLYHIVSAVLRKNLRGAGRFPARYFFLYMRNWMYVIRLHARGLNTITARIFWLAYAGQLVAGFCLKRRGSKLAALFTGMRAGWGDALEPCSRVVTEWNNGSRV